MRRYSNPPGTPVELGELLGVPLDRNTIATETGPNQAQRRLREAHVARLVQDYVAGASVEDLITAYGVSRTTVYAHLDRNGTARPTRDGKLSTLQIRQAAESRQAGLPLTSIALALGVGEETVRRALRRFG